MRTQSPSVVSHVSRTFGALVLGPTVTYGVPSGLLLLTSKAHSEFSGLLAFVFAFIALIPVSYGLIRWSSRHIAQWENQWTATGDRSVFAGNSLLLQFALPILWLLSATEIPIRHKLLPFVSLFVISSVLLSVCRAQFLTAHKTLVEAKEPIPTENPLFQSGLYRNTPSSSNDQSKLIRSVTTTLLQNTLIELLLVTLSFATLATTMVIVRPLFAAYISGCFVMCAVVIGLSIALRKLERHALLSATSARVSISHSPLFEIVLVAGNSAGVLLLLWRAFDWEKNAPLSFKLVLQTVIVSAVFSTVCCALELRRKNLCFTTKS